MTDWKKVLEDASQIRQKFIDCLDEEMEPEAIITSALSIIYETTEIFDDDLTADFSTYSNLGQFLIAHPDEKISVEEVHGQVIFVASCGETCEVPEALNESTFWNKNRPNYIS